MHPRDQIVMIMERIYGNGMTTTSGGNLSILDDDGSVWMTPAGVDKGNLHARDIVRLTSDGAVHGLHKPSSEAPFHQAVYKSRPDMRAVLHAHPAALVTFSIVKQIPDTRIIPTARHVCGEVGYAPYALPGSTELGKVIADTFAQGFNTVLLENHGIVTAGANLFLAFQRFETLDYCARIAAHATRLGTIRPLTEAQLALLEQKKCMPEEFAPENHSSHEKEMRKAMCNFIQRAYNQQLITSTDGTFSTRIDKERFLITPYGMDRKYLEPRDLVLIRDGRREAGKLPSRSVRLHTRIYEQHPDIDAVIIAHPPHVIAFAVSSTPFDTRTIPESYLVLRDVPVVPYGTPFMDQERIVEMLGNDHPLILVANDCLIVSGRNLLHAYDRLEVADFSARAILTAKSLGPIDPISEEQVQALNRTFQL